MIFLNTVRVATGDTDVLEAYHDIDSAIREIALLAWESPGNHWVDYLMDEQTGEVVAVAIFGPECELLITCADGRQLRFEMSDSYRE